MIWYDKDSYSISLDTSTLKLIVQNKISNRLLHQAHLSYAGYGVYTFSEERKILTFSNAKNG